VLAVVLLFRATLWRLLLLAWKPGPERFYAQNLILAFLPAAAIGAVLHGTITRLLFSPWVVCFALILGGIAIIAIERWRPEPSIHSVPQMGPLAALLIGFGQALAMIPGTSRSGATIITALLVGVDRRTAAEFSFVLAIPTMFAATAYSLYKARAELDLSGLGQIAIGFTAAFIVALIVVRWLMKVISRIGFTPFGWYRIALGCTMLAFLMLR
jgi:undecaprenyl-diphosphatase